MIRMFALFLAFSVMSADAEERRLSGVDIRDLLTGAVTAAPRDGGEILQTFFADRRTRYDDGRESWGLWEVRGDQYCSNWPPSPAWVCYDMFGWQQDGRQWVVWIGESGTRFEGYVRP